MAKRVDLIATADKRLRTMAAAKHLEDRLGRPVSRSTLFGWRIEHYKDGRNAIFLQSVLDRFADQRIEQVDQQLFGSSPRKAA